MTESEPQEALDVRFEELNAIEADFEDAELEIIRQSNALQATNYKKRAEIVKKIPHFWTIVFEMAPPEVDNFIQPTDAKIFAESLESLEVSRFEISDPKGSPRSFALKLQFKENDYFEDKVLEKKFWFRKTKDWEGLVSEPVEIHWKKGQDLTGGLTDAAFKFSEARKKSLGGVSGSSVREKEVKLAEYKELAAKIEESAVGSVSFFSIFGFVSSYRWVSAEESEEATNAQRERIEDIKAGKKVEAEDEEEEEEETEGFDLQEVEVFPGGDEVVTLIAEDIWPNAIRYYKQRFEDDNDEEGLSEVSMMDEDESDEDDVDQPVNIRALVGKKGSKDDRSPPSKKQRKS